VSGGSPSDPLEAWPAFAAEVRARLEQGRAAYGDRSFSADPDELLRELQQEALDLAGWGFVLFRRIEAMRARLSPVPVSNPSPGGPIERRRTRT
jgi:hypothetical protein